MTEFSKSRRKCPFSPHLNAHRYDSVITQQLYYLDNIDCIATKRLVSFKAMALDTGNHQVSYCTLCSLQSLLGRLLHLCHPTNHALNRKLKHPCSFLYLIFECLRKRKLCCIRCTVCIFKRENSTDVHHSNVNEFSSW